MKKYLSLWTYFRRGHHVYLVFAMSLLNFIVIQYKLMVESIPWLEKFFPSMWMFGVISMCAYVPMATLMGYIDHKKISLPRDCELVAKANPYSRDIAKALSLISAGKKEEAQKILKKWH